MIFTFLASIALFHLFVGLIYAFKEDKQVHDYASVVFVISSAAVCVNFLVDKIFK